MFAASVAEEGGRFGGDAKGRRDGAASAFGRARPEAAVFGASCLTELLGSRFAHCAAVGRRGYCRPAASSSAAARGAHGCISSSMAPDHCVPRLLCPFRNIVATLALPTVAATIAADLRGHFANPVKWACLDSCLDKTTSLKVQVLKVC